MQTKTELPYKGTESNAKQLHFRFNLDIPNRTKTI